MVKGLHRTKKGGFERTSSNPTGSATALGGGPLERKFCLLYSRCCHFKKNWLGSSLGTTLRNATNATYMTVQAKRASQGFIERTRGTSLN